MYKLIKYFKPNCTPCKIMDRTLLEFLKSHPEVELKSINVNDLSTQEYLNLKLKTLPTVSLFKEGEWLATCVGSTQPAPFTLWFDQVVS